MPPITRPKPDQRDEQIEELLRQNAALTKSVGDLQAVSKAYAGTLRDLSRPDPRQFVHDILADRMLDTPGPTTWHKLVGNSGHVRQLARQLLANERDFRAAVAAWYRWIGKSILVGVRQALDPSLLALDSLVTDQHRERLRRIVEEHVRRGALLSASIEYEMHITRPSAKAVLNYVAKGVSNFIWGLPERVLSAVKLAVAGIMATFSADHVIAPILDRVEKAAAGAEPGTMAEAVKLQVFGKDRADTVAGGVAVTNNAAGANAGTAAAGQVLGEEGKVNSKMWSTLHGTGQIDSRVRSSHREANGQTVDLNGKFTLSRNDGGGFETCDHPADPGLSEGNKRYCRCLAIFLWVKS